VSKRVLATAFLAALCALGALGAVAQAKPTKVKTVFKARIGWFYNDQPDFPQTKVGSQILYWGTCAEAGGVKIAFPKGAHLYAGYNGDFSANKPPVALLSGPPLNPSDPFKAELYVGDLATPGKKQLTVKCQGLVHGKLSTLFSGKMATEYVRQDVNLSPPGAIVSFNLLDLFGTEPSNQSVIARSCSEPGTPSITLTSPALAAGPSGGAYVTLPASDIEGTFEGTVTPSKEAGPGEYEAIVSCGSGRVGIGKIALR
jgi:hypothetical protein